MAWLGVCSDFAYTVVHLNFSTTKYLALKIVAVVVTRVSHKIINGSALHVQIFPLQEGGSGVDSEAVVYHMLMNKCPICGLPVPSVLYWHAVLHCTCSVNSTTNTTSIGEFLWQA